MVVTVHVRLAALLAKVAVTAVSTDIDTEQVPVPLHPPPVQPVNLEPVAAVAVRTTVSVELYVAEQAVPQLIPVGFDVTVPVPDPEWVTMSVFCTSVKVAVTDLAAVIDTVQVPVPEQAPDQPVKLEPFTGVAVKTTEAVEL